MWALLRASLAFQAADPPRLTPWLGPLPQMGWAEACTHPMACLRAWKASSVLHPPQSAVTGQPAPRDQTSRVVHVWTIADTVTPCPAAAAAAADLVTAAITAAAGAVMLLVVCSYLCCCCCSAPEFMLDTSSEGHCSCHAHSGGLRLLGPA